MKDLLKDKALLAMATAMVVILAALAWLALRPKAGTSTPAGNVERNQQAAHGGQPDGAADGGTDAGKPDTAGKAESEDAAHQRKVQMLTAKIQEVLKRFKAGNVDADTARALLAELDEKLQAAGGKAAGAAIVAFLDSGEDAATGLDFLVGEGGVLDEAPSLRTAMLDKLGKLSAKDAVEYSKKIFDQARNADEWAVNMRNLAWNNGDKKFTGELEKRLEQMLDKSEWLQKPTAGFVEAFDLAVYLGGRQQVANMASVLNLGQENGLDHAAFLSLDRITLREPDTVFGYLKQDPSLMTWSPEVRASLMARATDTNSQLQREAVEAYMQNPQTSAEEFKQFAELFPHRSYNIGPRLATKEENLPGMTEMAAADLNALKTVQQWIADPRFAQRQTELNGIKDRLLEYQKQIEQAKKEGSLK